MATSGKPPPGVVQHLMSSAYSVQCHTQGGVAWKWDRQPGSLVPKGGYLISCPLSSSGAGPSSQPLGASADSVLPRHPASQGGGVRRAGARPHFLGIANSGLRPPKGIALLGQTLWAPVYRLCRILGEAQDGLAIVGTRASPRGPYSELAATPTPMHPSKAFALLATPQHHRSYVYVCVLRKASLSWSLLPKVLLESFHTKAHSLQPAFQVSRDPSSWETCVICIQLCADSVFEPVSLDNLGLHGTFYVDHRLASNSEFILLLRRKC